MEPIVIYPMVVLLFLLALIAIGLFWTVLSFTVDFIQEMWEARARRKGTRG
jgi:hypothetical protein